MKSIDKYLQEGRELDHSESVKAILHRGPHILIVRRQEGSAGAGQWDLPGGCIEDGEEKVAALKREVFEEVGLKTDKEKYQEKIDLKIPEAGVDSTMNIYMADATDIDVTIKPATWAGSDGKPEHNEYKWIEFKHDLENLPMLPELKKVVLKHLNDRS